MRVANCRDSPLAGQRLVEVHRPAAGHQKHMFHAKIGDELQDVVGQLRYHAVRPPSTASTDPVM